MLKQFLKGNTPLPVLVDILQVSLVRTQHVGHLRDVRRLVVTMSRARFGLYVFGRKLVSINSEFCRMLQPSNLTK